MSKENIPLKDCRKCDRLEGCPLPSDGLDMRLCFHNIKSKTKKTGYGKPGAF